MRASPGAVSASPIKDRALVPLDVIELCFSHVRRADDVRRDDPHSSLGDRSHWAPRSEWHPQYTRKTDLQRSIEGFSDLGSHGYPAAWHRHHDRIGAAHMREQIRQLLPGRAFPRTGMTVPRHGRTRLKIRPLDRTGPSPLAAPARGGDAAEKSMGGCHGLDG